MRRDGSLRASGGFDVLLFGDWWQLEPVTGTALFSNPADAPSMTAWHGMNLLWERRRMPFAGVRYYSLGKKDNFLFFTDFSDFLGRLQPSKTTIQKTLNTLGVE